MMTKILQNTFLLFLILITSCNNTMTKAVSEYYQMPPPDYSYVVQPVYKVSKESIEKELEKFYFAEDAKVGVVGFHGYDIETKQQKDEVYWFKIIILNSQIISNYDNEIKMNMFTREVAERVIPKIENINDYDRVQISVIKQEIIDGIKNERKENVFYTLPDLALTELFNEE